MEGLELPFSAFDGCSSGVAWSPDKSVAAVTLTKDGTPDICLLKATSGQERARVMTNQVADTGITCLRDGKGLAFVSDRDGLLQLVMVAANGFNRRRIGPSSSCSPSPEWHPFAAHLPYTGREGTSFKCSSWNLPTQKSY